MSDSNILTDRQRAVLEFIEARIIDRGQPPTIREIGARFKISSTNGVRTHLTALVKKGFLKKQRLVSRGLELTRSLTKGAGTVPLVGSVPAGVPIDAIENIEGEIALDLSFLPKGDSFSLRVVGESMKDAGIFNNDLVLVRKQQVANKGDIVVALLNGEATVKTYLPDGDTIILQPANDAFEPIVVQKSSGEFQLVGRVVGLLRRIP